MRNLIIKKIYKNKKIQNYTILEFVGKGRFGKCFYAESNTGYKVILKKFRKGYLKTNTEKNKYEAVILSKIDDPRVPEFLGIVNHKFFYGFILKALPGTTVQDLLFKKNHKFNNEEIYNIGRQLISIIKYLHKIGIVHRDISISNVLVDECKVYLIDFGLARFADNNKYRYNLDYSYLGDFLLYLQYSSFITNKKIKELPWYLELQLTDKQKKFIKKLLGVDTIYNSIEDIEIDFITAFSH